MSDASNVHGARFFTERRAVRTESKVANQKLVVGFPGIAGRGNVHVLGARIRALLDFDAHRMQVLRSVEGDEHGLRARLRSHPAASPGSTLRIEYVVDRKELLFRRYVHTCDGHEVDFAFRRHRRPRGTSNDSSLHASTLAPAVPSTGMPARHEGVMGLRLVSIGPRFADLAPFRSQKGRNSPFDDSSSSTLGAWSGAARNVLCIGSWLALAPGSSSF